MLFSYVKATVVIFVRNGAASPWMHQLHRQISGDMLMAGLDMGSVIPNTGDSPRQGTPFLTAFYQMKCYFVSKLIAQGNVNSWKFKMLLGILNLLSM